MTQFDNDLDVLRDIVAAGDAERTAQAVAENTQLVGTPTREALAAMLASESYGDVFDVPAHSLPQHSTARKLARAKADRLLGLGIADIFTPDRPTVRETLRQARTIDVHGDDIEWVEQPVDILLGLLTDRAALEAAATVVRECTVCRGEGWEIGIEYENDGTPVQIQVDCDHDAAKRNHAAAVLARHKSCSDCGGIGTRFTMIYGGESSGFTVDDEACVHDAEGNRVA